MVAYTLPLNMGEFYRLLRYQTAAHRQPYTEWLESLRDRVGVSVIKAHVSRMELGHFGKARWIGKGLWELKIKFGPGYRIYYLLNQEHVVILLCGGDKGSQDRDIRKAKEYAADYWRRT
jgi:putative addiction module killer protein